MRTSVLIAVLLIHLNAQSSDIRDNSISLDFSHIFSGGIGVRYEHAVLPFMNITVPLEARFRTLSPLPSVAVNGIRIIAWSALPDAIVLTGVGAKFHYSGWYIEPMLKLGYAQITYHGAAGTKHLATFQPSLLVGYNTTLDFGLFINVGVGISGRLYTPSADAKSFFQPDGVFSVGYAW
jgi:hypothetical protein